MVLLPDLHDLDFKSPDGAALLRAVGRLHGVALVRAAARMERMFLLRSPWAPGLRFVGALASNPTAFSRAADAKLSFAGAGESIEDAFVSCVGEAVERLSQFEQPGDATSGRICDVAGQLTAPVLDLVQQHCQASRIDFSEVTDWMLARSLPTGTSSLVPADWVLRRAIDGVLTDHGSALSTGTAAGPNAESATLRALLELVERDAASLWWLGGCRARPLCFESSGLAEAVRLAMLFRLGSTDRVSWCLDITSDIAIPTIAAISVSASGRDFVCGLAARLSQAEAVRSAVTELCQLEIGLMLAKAKRDQSGETALTEIDRRHLLRADRIDAATCDLIHPKGAPRSDAADDGKLATDAAQLGRLTEILAGAGVSFSLVEFSRKDFGIPVVKAIAPQLQALPASLTTKRLVGMTERAGGGTQWTADTPLT